MCTRIGDRSTRFDYLGPLQESDKSFYLFIGADVGRLWRFAVPENFLYTNTFVRKFRRSRLYPRAVAVIAVVVVQSHSAFFVFVNNADAVGSTRVRLFRRCDGRRTIHRVCRPVSWPS